MSKIIAIAESINIMSKTIGPAMKERNPGSDSGNGPGRSQGRR